MDASSLAMDALEINPSTVAAAPGSEQLGAFFTDLHHETPARGCLSRLNVYPPLTGPRVVGRCHFFSPSWVA